MNNPAWLMLGLFFAVLLVLALPLSKYLARIAQPEPVRGW